MTNSRGSQRTLTAFIQTSLDGYYSDNAGDMSFAHRPAEDREWTEFMTGNARSDAVLVLGRKTYEMMSQWWPTPDAAAMYPELAARMNSLPKLVFSHRLRTTDWNNTTLVRRDAVKAIREMKTKKGPNMSILGSGSLVRQLSQAGLVDVLQVVVNPVALGAGHSLLAGLDRREPLQLAKSRVFANGSIVLWYAPLPAQTLFNPRAPNV